MLPTMRATQSLVSTPWNWYHPTTRRQPQPSVNMERADRPSTAKWRGAKTIQTMEHAGGTWTTVESREEPREERWAAKTYTQALAQLDAWDRRSNLNLSVRGPHGPFDIEYVEAIRNLAISRGNFDEVKPLRREENKSQANFLKYGELIPGQGTIRYVFNYHVY